MNLSFWGQVGQVCYVQDPVDLDWHVVMKMTVRELYDKYSYSPLIMRQVELYLNNNWMRVYMCDEDIAWVKKGVDVTTVEINSVNDDDDDDLSMKDID